MPFSNKRNSRDDSPRRGKKNNDSFKPRSTDRSKPSFSSSDKKEGKHSREDRPFKKDGFGSKDFEKKDNFKKKSYSDRDERKPFDRELSFKDNDSKDGFKKKSYTDRNERKPFDRERSFKDNDNKDGFKKKPYSDRNERKPFNKERSFNDNDRRPSRDFDKKDGVKVRKPYNREHQEEEGDGNKTYFQKRKFSPAKKPATGKIEDDGLIRLNRYISNSGICSRRKADELIEAGVISVNGVVVTELGTKVDPAKDEIRYNDERLKREKMVYVLLNKPKDYITTTDDPQERRTVMQLVSKATKERIYPVGRLDRNTTGLLLLTNDGNLAEKLSHPRNNISKVYHVELNKNLTQGDFNKVQFGIELEDGFIKPDDISYVTGGSKNEIGIQIHSGKNRIVRRIFEHLGYDVIKLDRVVYANLTKKDLPRGRWRYLEERELIQLKHFIK